MTKKKSSRLTLLEARSSRIADLVDRLVDSRATTAAAIIRQLPRHQVDLCLLHAVSSVDERWRVRKPLPLPPSDEETEKMRAAIADILEASPAAIVPTLLALSDATARHQDRTEDDDKAAA